MSFPETRVTLIQRLAAGGSKLAELLDATDDVRTDGFYAAWVEDVVQQAVESLAAEYLLRGRGDYVRVLYSRVCEELSVAEVAQALDIKPTDVVNYFRHTRQQLSERLEQLVRQQVSRYSPSEEIDSEFQEEWQRLGDYLADQGGLEKALRRTYEVLDPVQSRTRRERGLTRAVTHLTTIMRPPPPPTSSPKKGWPPIRGKGIRSERRTWIVLVPSWTIRWTSPSHPAPADRRISTNPAAVLHQRPNAAMNYGEGRCLRPSSNT
jgi:hypothetical protein